MKTQKQCKLLGLYLTLLNYSVDFIHHQEDEHDLYCFRHDGKGVAITEIVSSGGSIENYKEFVELATAKSGGK